MQDFDVIYSRIAANKVLPAAVVPSAEHAIPLAQALLEGGLDVMEVTFRNADAAECVRRITEKIPKMLCGAGTLLSAASIDEAMSAGATFGLSPGFNPSVVKAAMERAFPFIPGVQTAGEMEQALELGCTHVKFFPAEAAGGISILKALSAPYKHTALKIIPLGGISPANLADYLNLDIVPAVGGSWLANAEMLNQKNYQKITELTREAVSLIPSN